MSMSRQPGKSTAGDAWKPASAIVFEDVVAAVGGEVAGLVSRLPDGVDVIERSIADGADPDGLALLLGSLPDADEVERLSAALDDPVALNELLALRDRDHFKAARAVNRTRGDAGRRVSP
jgi:hypothetical protein